MAVSLVCVVMTIAPSFAGHSMKYVLFCFATLAVSFTARAQWTPVSSPTTENLWGVCYGANQFVAVGTAGTILTSPTGTAWTARASGTSEWLTAVCFASDRALYVAVGDHGTILTSPDTLVWTPRTSSTTQRLNNIAYAAGRWIAVGEAGTVATSTDAIAWSTASVGGGWLRAITATADTFFISGQKGILFSTADGATFHLVARLDHIIEALVSDGVSLYAVGDHFTSGSTDSGLTWTSLSVPMNFTSGYYRGALPVALSLRLVGEAGMVASQPIVTLFGGLATSSAVGTQNLNALAAGPAEFVAVGDSGVILRQSHQLSPASAFNADISAPRSYLNRPLVLSAMFELPPPLDYRWTLNGAPLSNATGPSLVLPSVTAVQAGRYSLTASSTFGSDTVNFDVSPLPAPPSDVVDDHFIAQLSTAWSRTLIALPNGQYLITAVAYDNTSFQNIQFLNRLNHDGSWDTTFHTALASDQLIVLPDGQILVHLPSASPAGYRRLNADGSIDPSFLLSASHRELIQLVDGRLLGFTLTANAALFSRYLPDGSVDPTYSPTSVQLSASANLAGIFRTTPYTHDQFGRILLAVAFAEQHSFSRPYNWGIDESYLLRLSPDGTIDASFPVVRIAESLDQLIIVGDRIFTRSYTSSIIGSDGQGGPHSKATFHRLLTDTTPDPGYFSFIHESTGSTPGSNGVLTPDGGVIVPAKDGLVRYDINGLVDHGFSARLDHPDLVLGLTLCPDGSLLITGSFTSLNGVPTAGLARVVPTTDAYATRLSNLSIRTTAGIGDQTLIAGFVVAGDASASRSVLLRAVGPGLIPLGLGARDILADPQLNLHRGSAALASNDDWDFSLDATATALGAFPLTRSSKDAALLTPLAPGAYTAHVTASGSATASGLALIELYDADPAPTSASSPRLVNLSGRARVGTGDSVLIAGFVIAGQSTKRVLIRAIGPGLLDQGVTDALLDPELSVHHGAETAGANDNWSSVDTSASTVFTAVGAFPLRVGSKDAALILDLPPGVYTTVVKGMNASTGTALVEIYEVP